MVSEDWTLSVGITADDNILDARKKVAEAKAKSSVDESQPSAASMENTARAIEIWVNEGGAGGEANP